MSASRFHGLLLVRDEDDIIAQSIRHALTWIDSIWVLDTGSTDETYDILCDLAKSDSRIHLLGRHELVFDQSLRSFVFSEARRTFEDGDWIVKLDADEFFHVSPRIFVEGFVKRHEGLVDLRWYYFRLTREEVAAYGGDAEVLKDRARPIGDRRRYFKLPPHREPRLFRYRSSMRYAASNNAPFFAGIPCPIPIPVRHYPHRDPIQMRKRFELRSRMKQLGSNESAHWNIGDWTEELVSAETGSAGHSSALSAEAGHDDGELLHWDFGADLPRIADAVRPPRGLVQLAKRAFYGGPVRLADRMKPDFAEPDLLQRRSVHRSGRSSVYG